MINKTKSKKKVARRKNPVNSSKLTLLVKLLTETKNLVKDINKDSSLISAINNNETSLDVWQKIIFESQLLKNQLSILTDSIS